MQVIPKDTIIFLRELKLNNNRDWFNANKQRFNSIHSGIKEFANATDTYYADWDTKGPAVAGTPPREASDAHV